MQIKKRVLSAVSSKLTMTSRSSHRSATSNGSTSATNGQYGSAEPRSVASPSIYLSPAVTSRSVISIEVPSISSSCSRSSRVNISDGFPDGYRTNMLWNFAKVDDDINPMAKHEVAALPLDSQQRVLLKDLLFCLSGTRGDYIIPSEEAITGKSAYETRFIVNMQLDKSLTEMVQEILPLASHFMGIQKVIAATDGRGQVNNALNAALEDLCHDYYVSVERNDALQILIFHFARSCCSCKQNWNRRRIC